MNSRLAWYDISIGTLWFHNLQSARCPRWQVIADFSIGSIWFLNWLDMFSQLAKYDFTICKVQGAGGGQLRQVIADFSIGSIWFLNWLDMISQLAKYDFSIGTLWFLNLQSARCRRRATATSDCWPADFSGRQSVAQNAAHSPAFVYISSLFFFLFLKSILNFSLGI